MIAITFIIFSKSWPTEDANTEKMEYMLKKQKNKSLKIRISFEIFFNFATL